MKIVIAWNHGMPDCTKCRSLTVLRPKSTRANPVETIKIVHAVCGCNNLSEPEQDLATQYWTHNHRRPNSGCPNACCDTSYIDFKNEGNRGLGSQEPKSASRNDSSDQRIWQQLNLAIAETLLWHIQDHLFDICNDQPACLKDAHQTPLIAGWQQHPSAAFVLAFFVTPHKVETIAVLKFSDDWRVLRPIVQPFG